MSQAPDLSTLLGLAGSLVLVIAAILGAGWIYSRLRVAGSGRSLVINVLAAQSVGPKERIALVQIGDKQIAVGVAPGSVNTLHVFDSHVIAMPERREAAPFADKLRAAIARVGSR